MGSPFLVLTRVHTLALQSPSLQSRHPCNYTSVPVLFYMCSIYAFGAPPVFKKTPPVKRPFRSVPVKRHRGEPGHTRDTRDTWAHAGTRITRTNLTTIHPNPSGKKTPGGAGTHTGHTSAHADTRRTQTNITTIQTQRHTRTTTRHSRRYPKPRPTQQQQEQPQARSRPLPAADSEEAAPSEPNPASTRSQSTVLLAISKFGGGEM